MRYGRDDLLFLLLIICVLTIGAVISSPPARDLCKCGVACACGDPAAK